MNENNIGSVIVIKIIDGNSSKPAGIITKRDVVRIIGLLQSSLLRIPIREIMSKPLITLSPNNTIKDAIQTCSQIISERIPIVEKENLEGVITEKIYSKQ